MKKMRFAQLVMLGTAILFIALGIWEKEPATVLQKAVRICLECIGIG